MERVKGARCLQSHHSKTAKTSKHPCPSSASLLVILVPSCPLSFPSTRNHGLNSIFQLLDVRRWRHAPGSDVTPSRQSKRWHRDSCDSLSFKIIENQGHLYWSPPRWLKMCAYAQLLTLRRILENDLELLRFTTYTEVSICFTISESKNQTYGTLCPSHEFITNSPRLFLLHWNSGTSNKHLLRLQEFQKVENETQKRGHLLKEGPEGKIKIWKKIMLDNRLGISWNVIVCTHVNTSR